MRTDEKTKASSITEVRHVYHSPRWTAEIADCSMPMTFDQYGKCSYGCFYCFANYQKAVGVAKKNFLSDELIAVNVDRVRRIFTLKSKSQFAPIIEKKITLQWGGMADPFCDYEKRFGVGLRCLELFKELDYPICFSTKGTWWTKDSRYVDLFRGQKNWNTKISIITLDRKLAKLTEACVPSPEERLKAMERIASWGAGGVTLRLRPFIIGVSCGTYEELIRRAADAGATAFSTEFFCAEVRSQMLKSDLARVSREVGFNIFNFYKKHSYTSGYMRLNRKVKRKYIDRMEELCSKLGMRFYVSDAHFKERCANGSCCGLPDSWNYARGQWCEALQIAKEKGRVRWSQMSKHLQHLKKFLYKNADGFNTGSCERRAKFHECTMYDYVHHVWNDTTNGQNPYYMYEGILTPDGTDKEGNLIYRYDKEKE